MKQLLQSFNAWMDTSGPLILILCLGFAAIAYYLLR